MDFPTQLVKLITALVVLIATAISAYVVLRGERLPNDPIPSVSPNEGGTEPASRIIIEFAEAEFGALLISQIAPFLRHENCREATVRAFDFRETPTPASDTTAGLMGSWIEVSLEVIQVPTANPEIVVAKGNGQGNSPLNAAAAARAKLLKSIGQNMKDVLPQCT